MYTSLLDHSCKNQVETLLVFTYISAITAEKVPMLYVIPCISGYTPAIYTRQFIQVMCFSRKRFHSYSCCSSAGWLSDGQYRSGRRGGLRINGNGGSSWCTSCLPGGYTICPRRNRSEISSRVGIVCSIDAVRYSGSRCGSSNCYRTSGDCAGRLG